MTGEPIRVHPIRTDVPGVTFGRLIATELRKLVDTRANRAVLAVVLGLWVISFIAVVGSGMDGTYGQYTDVFGGICSFLAPVVTIMLVTSEWSQRGALQTFTVEPRRERVIAAKFVAVALFTAVLIALVMLLGAVATAAGGGSFEGFGDTLLGQVVVQYFAVAMAFGFGLAMLNSPAAIVCYYVIPMVVSLVGVFIEVYRDHLADWIDRYSVVAPFGYGDLSGEAWQHLVVGAVVWAAVPLMIGLVRVMSAEVK